MHFVGAVGQPQGAQVGPGAGQEGVLADAQGAVHLNGAVDHVGGHFRGDHFDHGDFLAGHLITDGVHHVRRFQGHQPGLLDLQTRAGDVLADRIELGQLAAEGLALFHPLAHGFQGALGDADGTHAVVDTARAQAALGDFEAAAFAENQVAGRHPHVGEGDFRVALGGVVVAEHVQGALDLHAGGVQRYQNL